MVKLKMSHETVNKRKKSDEGREIKLFKRGKELPEETFF